MQELNETDQLNQKQIIVMSILPLMLLGMFAYLIFHISDEDSKKELTLKSFSQGKSFLCPTTPFNHSSKLLVSKEGGWRLYKDSSVIKQESVMDLAMCEMQ